MAILTSNLSQKTILNLHRPLHIELVEPTDYPKIKQIASDWYYLASLKRMQTSPIDEKQAYDQLSSSAYINQQISELHNDWFDDIYVCKDNQEKIHGIAVCCGRKSEIYCDYLATNPVNIRCNVNLTEIDRVEGVGKTFIKYGEEEFFKKRNMSLSGIPLNSSRSFFHQQLGLQEEARGRIIKAHPNLSSKL